MNGRIIAKVFYTPVSAPKDINVIELVSEKHEEDLKRIDEAIKMVVSKKVKKPLEIKPNFAVEFFRDFEKKKIQELFRLPEKEIKQLFKELSDYMYTRAKEEKKYLGLILTDNYLFLYHFVPDKTVTFDENKIQEFVKYLDPSTTTKFIFIVKSELAIEYYKLAGEECPSLAYNPYAYGVFDKNNTKGMKKLTGLDSNPDYESKGRVKVRIERNQTTDIVVETELLELHKINNTIRFDFDNGTASIKIENAPIKEIQVDDRKYDIDTGLPRIEYSLYEIDYFMEQYKPHRQNGLPLEETKDSVKISPDTLIEKPPRQNDKEAESVIYILADEVENIEPLVNEISQELTNASTVKIVELSDFEKSYKMFRVGEVILFAKFSKKNEGKLNVIAENFNERILLSEQLKQNNKLFRIINLIGLWTTVNLLKSPSFRNKLSEIVKNALTKLCGSKYAEIKEIDEIGIELKTGVKKVGGEEEGFFCSSSEEFANRLAKNFKKKSQKLVIYLIGIDDDTREYTLVPLNRARNEFHSDVRAELKNEGLTVLLSETVPIDEKYGILVYVLEKSNDNGFS